MKRNELSTAMILALVDNTESACSASNSWRRSGRADSRSRALAQERYKYPTL
ncbi:MAG: hypothetical protein II574_02590 [Ruminococcus sp.]|nr:hypothetical protein [Ruminococcus sp.]